MNGRVIGLVLPALCLGFLLRFPLDTRAEEARVEPPPSSEFLPWSVPRKRVSIEGEIVRVDLPARSIEVRAGEKTEKYLVSHRLRTRKDGVVVAASMAKVGDRCEVVGYLMDKDIVLVTELDLKSDGQ